MTVRRNFRFDPQWTIALAGTRKSDSILTELPHTVPFKDRVELEWYIE